MWNNLVSKNKYLLCYGDIILLIKVSELPNPSGILTVLAEIIGERQTERLYVYVCVSKEVFLPQTHNSTEEGRISLGKCGLRNIIPIEPKDIGIVD